ncbi:MAG TPA: aspartyl-phosphate phosphatase Spo0E family protein [Bacillota bacterium]|nr:aspartyl-phosphate phosphatase Spo0E family protein [Bacillota bacterium]
MNKKKRKMAELWDERGKTDSEILRVSVEIDELMNEYYKKI